MGTLFRFLLPAHFPWAHVLGSALTIRGSMASLYFHPFWRQPYFPGRAFERLHAQKFWRQPYFPGRAFERLHAQKGAFEPAKALSH